MNVNKTMSGALTPLERVGGVSALALDAAVALVQRPLAWRELMNQIWFIARVSTLPAVALAIPFTALVVAQGGYLLSAIGAADLSGGLAGLSVVTNNGPIVTVLAIGGAAATAICADLGARTIREEIDALRVMGTDPVQSLIVPRIIAATVVALLLTPVVTVAGLVCSYFYAVYVQHVTPGSWAATLTLLVSPPQVIISEIKAGLFGFAAGLIGCYQGVSVKGGPQGVGNAVNETIVYAFMLLSVINVVVSTIALKVSPT